MKSMLNPDAMKQAMGMFGGGGMPGMPPMGRMPGMGGMPGFPGMPPMGGLPGMGMPGMGGMPFPPMGGMMGMNPMMMGMMGGGSPFGRSAPTQTPQTDDPSKPPRERFAQQVEMIRALGIEDEETVLKALTENNGDMDKTMEALMSQFAEDYGDEGETDLSKK